MADIYCKHCGEPVDMDEFHVNGKKGDFKDWIRAFNQYGCPAVDALFDGDFPQQVNTKCTNDPIETPDRLAQIEASIEINGDDVDGIYSDLN